MTVWAVLIGLVVAFALLGPRLERYRVERKLRRVCAANGWQLLELRVFKSHYAATVSDGATVSRRKFILRRGEVEFV